VIKINKFQCVLIDAIQVFLYIQTKKYLVQVEFDSGVSAYWIHHISILMSVSEFDI
jgi:hypothetical protein